MAFDLLEDLKARGLIVQTSGDDRLTEWLKKAPRILYCGFDPTADSLHIGSLIPLLTLRRFQLAGHQPIALIGGATGLIGDPSFKSKERALHSHETVSKWAEALQNQMASFLDLDGSVGALVVNNIAWTRNLELLTFLREIGKHFSVSSMIAKESVKQRIERDGDGISFTEFTYMILQSYDFTELQKRFGCSLQIGGSDQWGNITEGIELTRRLCGVKVHGLTMPLVTKADGTKFGKTEDGTIWLDPRKTSPYSFYQFWINTADSDVYKFLKFFTFLSLTEIESIESHDRIHAGRPEAQQRLASELTLMVHGSVGLSAAKRISQSLFTGSVENLSESDFEQLIQDGLPVTQITTNQQGSTLTNLLTEVGMATSGKQAKDALLGGGLLINGQPVNAKQNTDLESCFNSSKALFGKYFLTRLGKKKYHLFNLS